MRTFGCDHCGQPLPGKAAQDAEKVTNPFDAGPADFNRLVEQWVPLTLLLNSLNRSLGARTTRIRSRSADEPSRSCGSSTT